MLAARREGLDDNHMASAAGTRRCRCQPALDGSDFFGALKPTATNIAICDASAFVDEDPFSEHEIKVGDAAIALDPLSSQGVQAALRSAVQGGAVVHTLLSGGDVGAALEFYRNAVTELAAHHQTIAAKYYFRLRSLAQCKILAHAVCCCRQFGNAASGSPGPIRRSSAFSLARCAVRASSDPDGRGNQVPDGAALSS